MPTVPWPAMTSGSSNGCTKVMPSRFCSSSGPGRRRRSCRRAAPPRRRAPAHGVDLHARRGHRHHDDGAAAQAFGAQCHALRVVAGRGADDAAGQLSGIVRHLVVGAAHVVHGACRMRRRWSGRQRCAPRGRAAGTGVGGSARTSRAGVGETGRRIICQPAVTTGAAPDEDPGVWGTGGRIHHWRRWRRQRGCLAHPMRTVSSTGMLQCNIPGGV